MKLIWIYLLIGSQSRSVEVGGEASGFHDEERHNFDSYQNETTTLQEM